MKDELPENVKRQTNLWIVAGLALALPSTILGVCLGLIYLLNKGLISLPVLIIAVILVVANTFFLMVKYVANKK